MADVLPARAPSLQPEHPIAATYITMERPSTPAVEQPSSPHPSDVLSPPQSIGSLGVSPAPVRAVSPSGEKRKAEAGPAKPAASVKRRKLTVQEQAQKVAEKKAKEQEKADQKAKRDEEKRVKEAEKEAKDEERRKKNEEKEEKKRVKELDQQRKEEEKRKKEEEVKKKQASQMKLGAFFMKPQQRASPQPPASEPPASSPEGYRRRSLSLEPGEPLPEATSVHPSPQKRLKVASAYERYFLPFEPPKYATCAPYNYFQATEEELADTRTALDFSMRPTDRGVEMDDAPDGNVASLLRLSDDQKQPRGRRTLPVKTIVERLHGSFEKPIDLTEDTTGSTSKPWDLLQQVPVKYLHFGEDVRPPYFGTYTKVQTLTEARKLARNPYSKTLPEANYDYDSEAEWEEPEEGEDLGDDEDDEESQDGGEDMEDFLDDEDDPLKNRRRQIATDLEPVSTGLVWEDAHGKPQPSETASTLPSDFDEFRRGVLLPSNPASIDPFSTAYWETEPTVPAMSATNESILNGVMKPPRLPLQAKPVATLNGITSVPATDIKRGPGRPPKEGAGPKRLVPAEYMEDFKRAIQGSDFTKIALVEMLKKKFPKVPKDAIQNTVTAVAARVGPSADSKKWVLT